MKKIHINIWDDYHDDGFVPDGQIQETFAYVEGDGLTDEDQRQVLGLLLRVVETLKDANSKVKAFVCWYDSAIKYPQWVGTERESILFKRWQLQLEHLTHAEREKLVDLLGQHPFQYNGQPVSVYSES